MSDPIPVASVPAISPLIQAIMPALIGLGGTIVGSAIVLTSQWLLERKKQEAEKKKKKAEKLEELVSLLYETPTLISTNSKIDLVNLHARITSITTVYFPEFNSSSTELLDFALDASKDPNKSHYDIKNALEDHIVRFSALMNDIDKYIKREFQ